MALIIESDVSLPGTHENLAPKKTITTKALYTEVPVSKLEIELDPGERGDTSREYIYGQGDEVKGHLLMNVYKDFRCLEIEIVLEMLADVTLRSRGASAAQNKAKNLLPSEWAIVSPVKRTSAIHVRSANYKIPFCIRIPKYYPLAGSFKGALGEIHYRVAGNVHTAVGRPRTPLRSIHTHKNIRVDSYLNLTTMPATTKPQKFEFRQDNSFFSKSTSLRFSLNVGQTGFLRGEEIKFQIQVVNPQQKTILNLKASLIKKIEYSSDATMKAKSAIVKTVEKSEPSSEKMQEWEDTITVTRNAYPTTKRIPIRHQYFIRVEIQTEDADNSSFARNIPIVIGTVREAESTEEDGESLGRSVSMLSISSYAESEYTMPPEYSELSTRRTSAETLPPAYDEAPTV